jgi:hypothetical protein
MLLDVLQQLDIVPTMPLYRDDSWSRGGGDHDDGSWIGGSACREVFSTVPTIVQLLSLMINCEITITSDSCPMGSAHVFNIKLKVDSCSRGNDITLQQQYKVTNASRTHNLHPGFPAFAKSDQQQHQHCKPRRLSSVRSGVVAL